MRTIDDLLNRDEDAWPDILAWVAESARTVEILPCDPEVGRHTLLSLQVTTRSPMGAITMRTGGLLIDHGWFRLLGSTGPRIGDGLIEWNASHGGVPLDPPLTGGLIVAYDALGGFFALNGGFWEGEQGTAYYYAPGTYAWVALGIGYTGLLRWALSDQVEGFYGEQRWPGWETEVERLGPDQAISVYPPLGFREGHSPADSQRRPIPARELWTFHHALGRQLANVPEGTAVRLVVED